MIEARWLAIREDDLEDACRSAIEVCWVLGDEVRPGDLLAALRSRSARGDDELMDAADSLADQSYRSSS